MTVLITIPLDSGLMEAADSRLLPNGVLRIAENVTLRRDGQLEVRPGDTALGLGTFNNRTLVAYDLFEFNERLFAFGDDDGQGYPTDLYEFVESAQAWKPMGGAGSKQLRLPPATELRDVGTTVDQDGDVTQAVIAAHNGVVLLAYRATGSAVIWAHAFKPATDSTLIYEQLSTGVNDATTLPVAIVTATGVFWAIGINATATRVSGHPYAPATDETFGATVNLDGPSGGAISQFAAAPIEGSSGFVTAAARSGPTIIIKKFNDAGVQQGSDITGTAEGASQIAVHADSVTNRITVMWLNSSSFVYKLQTFNLTTGASVVGPTTLFGGRTDTVVNPCSVQKHSVTATSLVVAATTDASGANGNQRQIELAEHGRDTHTLITQELQFHSQLSSAPILHDAGDAYFAWILPEGVPVPQGTGIAPIAPRTSNHLAVSHPITITGFAADIVQLACKDFELASFARGSLCKDAVTGKVYWGNLFRNNDAGISAQVTEVRLRSTARRQVAQLGNLVYISGGQPSVTDGRMLVEQGFTERPRFTAALASSNTGPGLLTNGGIYSYVETWEWLDADRNLCRSAPSLTYRITLGAADDTVTLPISSPHSQRCNRTAKAIQGSSVRCVIWRNTCAVTKTAATFTTSSVTPPSVSVALKVFGVAVDGGAFQTFAFSAAAVNATQIASEINSNTTGLTATVDGGRVIIASDTTGAASGLQLGGNADVATAFGYTLGQSFAGTQTIQPGPNLQRVGSVAVKLSDAYGGPTSFTDTVSDTSLRSHEVLYTEFQTPVPHHAPQPYDYCWPAGDAILAGGMPRRSEWARSKRLFNAEPVEFAEPGRLNFGGRANGELKAVAVQRQSNLLFTRVGLQVVEGEGPDHSGLGEFFAPDSLSIDGGVEDWQPLCRVSEGLFFKLDGTPKPKLYLMQEGGVAEWVGFAVQDLVEAFPNIVAAAHIRAQQHVAFACNNAAGDAAVILRYDLRRKIWFTHTVATTLRSLCSYQGRLVYVTSAGAVVRADLTPGSGTFVPYRIRTGSSGDFDSLGYGSLHKVGLLLELQGACSIEALISYDDAKTFKTLDAFALTGTAGDVFGKFWTPPEARTDRFVLEFRVTGASDSLGARLIKLLFEVEKAPGTARRGAADTK